MPKTREDTPAKQQLGHQIPPRSLPPQVPSERVELFLSLTRRQISAFPLSKSRLVSALLPRFQRCLQRETTLIDDLSSLPRTDDHGVSILLVCCPDPTLLPGPDELASHLANFVRHRRSDSPHVFSETLTSSTDAVPRCLVFIDLTPEPRWVHHRAVSIETPSTGEAPESDEEKVLTRIRANIRKAAEESGLTQQQIGIRMGYADSGAQNIVSRILRGSHDLRLRTLVSFANAVGKSVKDLMEE